MSRSLYTNAPVARPEHSTRPALQRAAITPVPEMNTVPPQVHDVLRSPGQPLDDASRADLELRFGHDFSHVRIHRDSHAAESARAINARAYTVGNHIVFGADRYQPEALSGRRLLTHELTHVVQQSESTPSDSVPEVIDPSPLAEREAEAASGNALNSGSPQPLKHLPPGTVARQAEEEEPGILGTIGGGLLGEFNEDPSVAMIGVDLGVSLVPILDQASDVRDISAHIYYMTVRRQYDRVLRWVGLVFTLIGLIPEVGSVIKSASKFVIKGVREVLSHLDDILRLIRRVLPQIGDVGRLQRYIATHWSRWVAFGTDLFTRVLNRISGWVSRASFLARRFAGGVVDALNYVRRMAPRKLADAYSWARNKIDSVLGQVRERLGRSSADAPPPALAPQSSAASAARTAEDEYNDFMRMLSEETDQPLFRAEGAPISMQPHSGASRARATMGVTGSYESAHNLPQSVGRGVAGYNPNAALTILLQRGIHRGLDQHWKQAFQQLRRQGRTTATAQEIHDIVVDSIRRSPLDPAVANSLVRRLEDEMFVEFGLSPTAIITLPYPNIRP